MVTPDKKAHPPNVPNYIVHFVLIPIVNDEEVAAKKKREALEREIELVKKEYEEKQKAKAEKRKAKEKDKGKDEEKDKAKESKQKDDDTDKKDEEEKNDKIKALSKEETKSEDGPRIYALHKTFYQKRVERIRSAEIAKRNRERLSNPTAFPSVPSGDP
ncbi:hypothetical protein B0A49_06124 [Cryomyces minteri]|uniref:Uncharacterized protein n=1 Tax=Cryomyces minteri TaxID=331657 RepID=A0A4U0X6W5_9PEZI|nr:hypothetical protein B0A49_06124 [Cryomyces minteri]